MSIALSSISEPATSLDHLIEYTQKSVKKQAATVHRLRSEGHEAADALKQLNEMIGTLAALRRKKKMTN